MTNARENNEFEAWVNGKFGSRITDLISKDFVLDIQEDHFKVSFSAWEDGLHFMKLFGGRTLD